MQTNLQVKDETRLHIGIIMDGNGRWAKSRGLNRIAGHHAGVSSLRSVAEAAPAMGIATLSVYAFSVDNWRRPADEVAGIMGLLHHYLVFELERLARAGVRLTVIGRRDRLAPDVVAAIAHAEVVTAGGTNLNLRLAIDYSARDAILSAATAPSDEVLTREAFARRLGVGSDVADVDLLIRTSGEQRLSDFLLWECAYAELYFTQTLWPDFSADDLAEALRAYAKRDRRFGGRPECATDPSGNTSDH
ncbi:MAG: di-trans,poly-cis-decaprenylcistransferase, partial [Pseudomonadota bacterium]